MRKLFLLFSAIFFTIHVWGQSLNTPNGTIGSTTNPTTGNVGIGTTSPDKIFTINHDSDASINIKNLSTSDRFTYLRFDRKDASGNNMHGYIGFDGTNDYLKINNANALSSVEHLIIDRNGYVGIGATGPDAKLDIENTYGDGFLFDNEIDTDKTKLIFKENSTDIFSFYYDGSASSPNNKFHIRDEYYGINIMSFVQQTGNIGIGTTDPQYANLEIRNADNTRYAGYFFTSATGNGNYAPLLVNQASGSSADKILRVRSNAIDRFTILGNGHVGIGTTDPTYLLSVKGTIGCGEVIVENVTGWADFVFEDNYNLMPLHELDSYIQENKHLPEIPTSEEVQENGISVGEMNAKLLQKIEELTLYLIEKDKEVNELRNEINKLNKLINEKL